MKFSWYQQQWQNIFRDLMSSGRTVSPRGLLVKEIENYRYELYPYNRFCGFEDRKLNLDYIKKEFLWYLKGDKFDLSILQHAKIWAGLVNDDKSINSNYGQYIFGDQNQFDLVVNELKNDKDSRRAIMMILQPYHLTMKTKDVPCTISMSFRIRNGKLTMSVRMRSQDAIFGMGNDAPCFSFIQEMVLCALQEYYPSLEMGRYHHSADSFHIYEKHFDMASRICNKKAKYSDVDCPRISGPTEVRYLREYWKDTGGPIPETFKFTKWLLAP